VGAHVLFNRYYLGDRTKEGQMGGECSKKGRDKKCRDLDIILVGGPKSRTALRRVMHRWEDNIKMDLEVMRWRIVDQFERGYEY
jgi:hypothetical protein